MYACVYVRGDSRDDLKAVLLDCVSSISPLYAVTEERAAVLDLRGLGKLFGSAPDIVQEIDRRTSAAGLTANVAVAANIDTAIAAAKGFPGITVIASGEEGRVLAPLPVALLGPTEDAAETLQCWGIRTFGELAALPERGVAERMGAEGLYLQKLARGWVRRPLVPHTDKLTFEDSIELEHALDLLEPLSFLLSRLLNGLCGRLEEQALATNAIELTLGLEDGSDFVRTLNLPFANRDAGNFLKLLQYGLDAHPPGAPIVKVTLKLTPVEPRRLQNGLFIPLAPEAEKLELTLARIAAVIGEGQAGSPEVLDTHRPDAFRVVKFDANAKPDMQASGPVQLGVRRFRPPVPARVEAVDGKPRRISARVMNGKIVAYAGPWRTCGEWWREDAWDRDEWDIALANGALYRIFSDRQGNWFVDGNYD
jgi:protein ImuB